MRMVSGLIEVFEELVEENRLPAGRYISSKEYAEITGEKPNTVRVQVSRGKIQSYIFGSRRWIHVTEIFKSEKMSVET